MLINTDRVWLWIEVCESELLTQLTWSEFQHVSSFLSNMNFFPYWLESRFKTELTLESKGEVKKL